MYNANYGFLYAKSSSRGNLAWHDTETSYSQYERVLEELDSIGVKRINVMVDSDYQVKEEVRKARDRYIEMGAAAGFEMAPITWTQKQKGVDDLYKHLFRDK